MTDVLSTFLFIGLLFVRVLRLLLLILLIFDWQLWWVVWSFEFGSSSATFFESSSESTVRVTEDSPTVVGVGPGKTFIRVLFTCLVGFPGNLDRPIFGPVAFTYYEFWKK